MRGDDGESFPYLRRRGALALIGLSSAIPTAPFMATGKLGADQIEEFRALLELLQGEDLFRVVMIHHPPARKRGDRFKYLIDTEAFAKVLREYGADLVLHGHDHVHSVVYLDGPDGKKVPMAGVPSASARAGHGDLAAYNLYSIEKAGGAWQCEAVTRGFRPRPGRHQRDRANGCFERLTACAINQRGGEERRDADDHGRTRTDGTRCQKRRALVPSARHARSAATRLESSASARSRSTRRPAT